MLGPAPRNESDDGNNGEKSNRLRKRAYLERRAGQCRRFAIGGPGSGRGCGDGSGREADGAMSSGPDSTSTVAMKRYPRPGTVSTNAGASRDSDDHPGIVGTWTVQVTLSDCVTNSPLGPPFNSLVTFHRGGTLSESAVYLPGERTSGHGTWDRRGGHTFEQRMVALMIFDTPGNLPGTPGFNPTLPIVPPSSPAGRRSVTRSHSPVQITLRRRERTRSSSSSGAVASRTGLLGTAAGQRFE